MLLIATNKADLTTDYLVLKLHERSIPFIRFNTEDLYYKAAIEIELSSTKDSVTLDYLGKNINIKNIDGVYFRRPLPPDLKPVIHEQDLEFAERELLETLTGFWRLIKTTRWMNHPKFLFLAKNKIEQLKIAKDIGFKIPNTLISSNKEKIKKFFEDNNCIIGKAVKHGFYAQKDLVKIALTKELTENQIEELEAYASIPMIYQTKINKFYDLRITVIGDKVFPTALYSQEHAISKIDWRSWDLEEKFDLKHQRVNIPKHISEKCIAITKYFNLNFSAIDMIFTDEKDYVFLELNPNGQWAWLEEKVGYPLRDSIIDFLMGEKLNGDRY